MLLFVGDDWAEDHHDVEVMDEAGKVLAVFLSNAMVTRTRP
jgi:hypothetical protein